MADLSVLLEAEKRGILPPDKAPLLQEARTRGLIPGNESQPQSTAGGVLHRLYEAFRDPTPDEVTGIFREHGIPPPDDPGSNTAKIASRLMALALVPYTAPTPVSQTPTTLPQIALPGPVQKAGELAAAYALPSVAGQASRAVRDAREAAQARRAAAAAEAAKPPLPRGSQALGRLAEGEQTTRGVVSGPAKGLGQTAEAEAGTRAFVGNDPRATYTPEEVAAEQAAHEAFLQKQRYEIEIEQIAQQHAAAEHAAAVQAQQHAIWHEQLQNSIRQDLLGDVQGGLTEAPGMRGPAGEDLSGQALSELQASRPRTLSEALQASQGADLDALRQAKQAAAWQRLAPVEEGAGARMPGLESQESPLRGEGLQAQSPLVEPAPSTPGELIATVNRQRRAAAMPEGSPGELIAKSREQTATGSLLAQADQARPGAAADLLREFLTSEKGAFSLDDFAASVARGGQLALRIYRRMGGMGYTLELPVKYSEPLIMGESRGNTWSGQWKRPLGLIEDSMTPAEHAWFAHNGAEVMRGRIPPPDMPGVTRWLEQWNHDTSPGVLARSDAVGVEHGVLNNYFPQELTQDARIALMERKGPLYEALAKVMGPIAINPEDLQAQAFATDFRTRRVGHIERSRVLHNVPARVEVDGKMVEVTHNNPFEVIPAYLDAVGKRFGIADVFGPESSQAVEAMMADAAHELSWRQAGDLKNAWENLQGVPFTDPVARAVYYMRPISNLVKSPLLTLSALGNQLSGWIPQASVMGISNALTSYTKALAHTFTGADIGGSAAALERGLEVQAWVQKGVMENLTYGLPRSQELFTEGTIRGALQKASRVPTALSLTDWVNRQINKTAVIGVADGFNKALMQAKAGDPAFLFDLAQYFNFGEGKMANWLRDGAIPREDIDRAMQLATGRWNLHKEFAVDIPRVFKHPGMQEVLSFVGWGRAVGTLSYQVLQQALTHPKALGVLFGSLTLASGTEDAIKRYLRGRTTDGDPQWQVVADSVFRSWALGLWGKYGGAVTHGLSQPGAADNPMQRVAGEFTPPFIRQLDTFVSMLTGKAEIGIRRGVPLVDAFMHVLLGRPSLQELSQQGQGLRRNLNRGTQRTLRRNLNR